MMNVFTMQESVKDHQDSVHFFSTATFEQSSVRSF